MISTNSASVNELLLQASNFEIARGYFSDILNAQLALFTLIVGALLALNWLYQRKVNRQIVEEEVSKEVKKVKDELKNELDKKQKELVDIIVQRLEIVGKDVGLLRGEVYRSMAQFWDSENSYVTAFIWWLRASVNFCLVPDEHMTRLCLQSARNSMKNVNAWYELNATNTGEAQRLLNVIDDKLYKIEKDLVYEAIKETLNKSPSFDN